MIHRVCPQRMNQYIHMTYLRERGRGNEESQQGSGVAMYPKN